MSRILLRRPVPVDAIDMRICEPLFRPLKCILQLALPLGNSKAQPTDQVCQAPTRQWRIDLNSRIDERVDPRAALSCIGGGRSLFVNCINSGSPVWPAHVPPAALIDSPLHNNG